MNMTKIKSAGQVYPDFLSLYTIDSDDEYIPEIILDEKMSGTQTQYLVKFQGYDMRENQWLSKNKLRNYPDVLDTWIFEKSQKPRKRTRLQKQEVKNEEERYPSSSKTQQVYDDIEEEIVRHRLKKNIEELSFDNIETVEENQTKIEVKKQTRLFTSKSHKYSNIIKQYLKDVEEAKNFVEFFKKSNLLSLL